MTTQTMEMTLPALGQGVDECILIATLVPVGQQVTRGDVVAEVETAKSTVDIMAEREGTIVEWIAEKGTILIVGDAFYRLEINRPDSPIRWTSERHNDRSYPESEKTTMTSPSRRHLETLVLDKLRVWNPEMSAADLDRPLLELDLDSLDKLELVHLLERECQVKADKQQIVRFEFLRDFVNYFLRLCETA